MAFSDWLAVLGQTRVEDVTNSGIGSFAMCSFGRGCLVLTGAAALWTAAGLVAAEPLLLYVSPVGNDGWSGALAEPKPDLTDGPLATLVGARDAIRRLRAGGATERPVEVRVRGGLYRPTEPIVFEPQDSGTELCPVAYVAYPGETPILSGGVPISGFTPWQGQVLRADLPADLGGPDGFRSLFVAGERHVRARYPNYDPADPYRKGFLYVRPDCFGEAVGAAHNAGDWLEWDVAVPTDGTYHVWLLYAHGMKQLGRDDMAGQTSFSVDGGEKTVLTNLPDSGGWQQFAWAKTATLSLQAGARTLRWTNDQGGGLNFDALVLTDDPDWSAASWRLPPVAPGRQRVIIQGEDYKASNGLQIARGSGLAATQSKTEFPFASGQVKLSWAEAPEAEVHLWPSSPASCRAFNEIVKLERIDAAAGLMGVSGKEAAVEICSGDRYFVENLMEELDCPGEWYLDRQARVLYLWPTAPLTGDTPVIAPRLTRLFEFRGEPEKPVRWIRLSGLTLQETDFTPDDGFVAYGRSTDGVLTLRETEGITIENCRLRNLGKAGLHSKRGSTTRIVGNEICYGAEGGIYVDESPRGTVISDNHIHHLGWVYKHVAGISTGDQVHGALIAHNHVHDTTRWGISLAHHTSTNNIVEYNHLHDLNTETYDTGGLEVTQHSREHRTQSIFRYNLIHDTGGYSSMMGRDMWNSWGIYLDSFAGGFTVHHNVVYGAQDGGLMVQGGKDNKIFNNLFVDNGPRRQILIANFANNSSGTEFHHNIVAFASPESVAVYAGRRMPETVATWDRNLYWLAGGGLRFCLPGDEPYAQWFRPFEFWRGLGFDKESVVADPQFVAAARHDYRLADTSPALSLGFEPIDLSTVGPRR